MGKSFSPYRDSLGRLRVPAVCPERSARMMQGRWTGSDVVRLRNGSWRVNFQTGEVVIFDLCIEGGKP